MTASSQEGYPRKSILLPHIDVSGDEGHPRWSPGHEFEDAGNGLSRWLTPPGLCASIRDDILDNWLDTCLRYEAAPDHFRAAYDYLDAHPAFWEFIPTSPPPARRWWQRTGWSSPARARPASHVTRLQNEDGIRRCVYISVGAVNPGTGEPHEQFYPPASAPTRIWAEAGPAQLYPASHCTESSIDHRLDCSAPTYELVIMRMALSVWTLYGNDRRICDLPPGAATHSASTAGGTGDE